MESPVTEQVFFTDKQLRERWHCSHMTIYRLRADGLLPPPIKLGRGCKNLTPAEAIRQLEQAPLNDERAA